MRNLSTYCSNAFGGLDNWKNSICCEIELFPSQSLDRVHYASFDEIINHPLTKEIADALSNGIRHPKCNDCWRKEDNGLNSLRTFSLPFVHTGERFEIDKEIVEDEINDKKIRRLVIHSGSMCNLACRTCGPWLSSGWWKEANYRTDNKESKFHMYPPDHLKNLHIKKILNEDLSKVRIIQILGGEPFLNLDHLAVIDKIINDGNSKKCELNYVTNGTVTPPKILLENAKHFKRVNFAMSLDAVGKQFHYIRTTGSWQDVLKNIGIVRRFDNIEINVNCVLSVLNIMYIEEVFKLCRFLEMPLSFVFLDNPKYYSPNILKSTEKVKVLSYLETLNEKNYNITPLVNYIKNSTFDTELRKRFFEEIELTKEFRGLDAKEYIPELINILED